MVDFTDFSKEFVEIADRSPFTVFLCGPSLNSKKPRPAAQLREALKTRLVKEKFEVVLGEDECINNPELRNIGVNLQDGELEFIVSKCNAIVVIADSVGSFCELGLFSWHASNKFSWHTKQRSGSNPIDIDFILLIDKKYRKDNSYLNDGPAAAVNGIGRRDFVNFKTYDLEEVVTKLKARRGLVTNDRRGRPKAN